MRRADRIAQTGKHGRPLRLMSRIAPSSARSRAICMALSRQAPSARGRTRAETQPRRRPSAGCHRRQYPAPMPRTTVASHLLTHTFPAKGSTNAFLVSVRLRCLTRRCGKNRSADKMDQAAADASDAAPRARPGPRGQVRATRLSGTILAPRRTPNAFRATAAWVSLCVSIPMMILRLGASCNSGLLWRALGPGEREGGQDCDGISPQAPIRSRTLRPAGAAREAERSMPRHEVNRKPDLPCPHHALSPAGLFNPRTDLGFHPIVWLVGEEYGFSA